MAVKVRPFAVACISVGATDKSLNTPPAEQGELSTAAHLDSPVLETPFERAELSWPSEVTALAERIFVAATLVSKKDQFFLHPGQTRRGPLPRHTLRIVALLGHGANSPGSPPMAPCMLIGSSSQCLVQYYLLRFRKQLVDLLPANLG